MGKTRRTADAYKATRIFAIDAWRVFHLLTAKTPESKFPQPADRVQLTLETWIDSGIWS